MKTTNPRLERELSDLSRAFPLWIADDFAFVIVSKLRLPAEYNKSCTDLLIELPPDYPVCPPGLGNNRVYVDPNLRYRNRILQDLHPGNTARFATPGFGPWAWFCYERIEWWPDRDDLITFVEMVRADLSCTKTKSILSSL